MGRRTQAERDAMTVEIGYALFAGAVLAGAVCLGVLHAVPALFGTPGGTSHTLKQAAAGLTAVTFFATVATVLIRFQHLRQPSQPGRTSPDS
ncbi:DUF6332 family protein [Streptomyces sp. NPDC005551]|uniref:DUF6332 family protein n=1 Tax=unclassified Streptomyces TaxID=2593676 RepID=UPI0033D9D4AC